MTPDQKDFLDKVRSSIVRCELLAKKAEEANLKVLASFLVECSRVLTIGIAEQEKVLPLAANVPPINVPPGWTRAAADAIERRKVLK